MTEPLEREYLRTTPIVLRAKKIRVEEVVELY